MTVHHLKYNILYRAIILLAILCPEYVSAAEQTPSILSEGRWVKIHTDTTSVYRIPYTTLSAWGFSDPDRVIVAGYGSVERANTLNTAPADLPVLPVYRDSEALYFYAEGDRRVLLNSTPTSASIVPYAAHYNYYSAGSYYFIGERPGISSPDMEETDTPVSASTRCVDTHYSLTHHVYDEAHKALRGLLSYSRDINASAPRQIDLDVQGHSGTAVLYYSYIWRHGESSTQAMAVKFSDGVLSSSITPDRLSRNTSNEHLLYSHKQNSRAALQLKSDATQVSAIFSNPGGVFSELALSNHTLIYERANEASATPATLHFTSLPADAAVRMTGVMPGFMAWDVTEPRSPRRLPVQTDGDESLIPVSGTSMRMHTFVTSGALPEPEYIADVTVQSVCTTEDADMLIVTTAATYDAALRLAEAHAKWQGLKVAVIRQSEIFNEYSSGAMHPNGLRQFVRDMASRQRPLRYILLFGHGSWDTRAVYDHSGAEYMVTYGTENLNEMCDETKSYVTDMYFGVLNDNISPSLATMRPSVDISVGRVPAMDSASAEAYVDKCITYLSDPFKAGYFNHAIISGGISDAGAHLEDAEDLGRIISSTLVHPTLNRAHLSLFRLSDLVTLESKDMKAYFDSRFGGTSRLFTYTGHSSRDFILHWAHTIQREEEVSYGSLPVVYLSSCSTTAIDLQSKSLGETMILHSPGPIVVIGAGGEVYLSNNVKLNTRFVELFYSPDAGECIGDVFRQAVNDTRTSDTQCINNFVYNFLGDPALPRYIPELSVNLTSADGTPVKDVDSRVAVASQSRVAIAGNVTKPDGSVDATFDGTLRIDIYAPASTRTTYAHVAKDPETQLTIDEDVIYSSAVTVTGGQWSAEVILPATSDEGICRMTLNAVSDNRVLAYGGSACLAMSESATVVPVDDDEAPEICLWLDSPDMTDGAEVSSTPMLHIEISDSGTGINLGAATIGGTPAVLLDGVSLRVPSLLMRAGEDGSAVCEYLMSNLSDGHHSITVKARDLAGNTASSTLNFTVRHADTSASLSVSDTLVREDVTFTVSHELGEDVVSQRLIVRDMEGRTVLSKDDVTFPYVWDLTGSDGFVVPDGAYRASVIINAHPYYTSTPETQFTIIKK